MIEPLLSLGADSVPASLPTTLMSSPTGCVIVATISE